MALGGSVLFEIAVSIETICLVLWDATLNAPTVNGSFTHLERTHLLGAKMVVRQLELRVGL